MFFVQSNFWICTSLSDLKGEITLKNEYLLAFAHAYLFIMQLFQIYTNPFNFFELDTDQVHSDWLI